MNTTESDALNAIYLSKLGLEGFRAYGAKTEITLPAGPSLTVIVGPNGLGKSTLFDSIEWGMTGALKRIDNTDAKPKEKEQSIGTKANVELLFSDGTKILRTSNGTGANVSFNDVQAAQSTIDNWLIADAAWRGMNGIADCLHFTHFLGQSTKQLFVHQDGKERWNRLEGPSKIQTLWAMEKTLGRRKTTVGFDDLEAKLKQKIFETEQELRFLAKIIDELGLQKEMARTGAALPPEEIEAGIAEIQQLLQQYFKPENLESEFKSGETRLVMQSLLMEQVEADLALKQLQLEEWSALAQIFMNYGVDHAAQLTALTLAKERVTQATALLQAAQTNENGLQLERDRIQTQINGFDTEITKLVQAVSHRNEIARINEENIQINTALDELSKRLAELSQFIAVKNTSLIALKEQNKRYETLHANKRDLEETQSNIIALQDLQKQHQAVLMQTNQLAENEPKLTLEHEASKSALIAIEKELLGLKQQWQQAKSTADTMTAALVQIAGALRNEDCSCPVCQSSFVEGKLKELATSSATLANERLSQIELARQTALLKQGQLQQSTDKLAQQLLAISKGRTAVAHAKKQAQTLEHALRAKPMLALVDVDRFADTCTARLAELTEQIAAAETEIAQAEDVTALESTIANLQTEKNSISEQKIAKTQKRDEAILRSEQLQVLLAIFSEPELVGMNQRLTSLRLNSEQAKAVLLEKNSVLDKLIATIANQKASHVTLMDDMAKHEANLLSIVKLQQGLQQKWQDLKYIGEPTPERIAETCRDQSEQRVKLKNLLLRHKRLLEGQRRYSAETSLQRLEGEKIQFLSKYPGKNELEVRLLLDERKKQENIENEKLEQVRVKRDQLVNAMKQNNASIREDIAIPLNNSVARFCNALMSDRDFNVNVDAIASATTAQALLSFQLDENKPNKNPLLYLSEGQLAAVSLCLLFGASTIYPWSRWKALLLDDPLHHNDSIHSAAFVDVIRNLIKYKGYQIVVSTHDMEQAGYFLRKCANAGIETQYWHLYGRSENGILMEGKS